MTTTSRAPDLLDRLAALATAALPDVTVSDGPDLDEGTHLDLVCIGWDGDEESDTEAVDATQEWAGLGAMAKNESLVVTCAAISVRGNGDMRSARAAAYASVAAIETGLRADPSLGFPPPTVVALRTGNLRQRQTPDGPEARVLFQIGVQTRI
jgi:hypothetical protein